MELIERIREFLNRLTELTAEELTELDGMIDEAMGQVDGESPDIAVMEEIVAAAETVAGETTRRAEEAAASDARAEELRSRFHQVRNDDEETPDGETPDGETPDGETPDGETPDAETPDGETPDADAEGIAAGAGGRAARMARGAGRPRVPSNEGPTPIALVASGGRGVPLGEELTQERLGFLLAETLNSMPRRGKARGEVIVASADWRDRYPEERRLTSDAESNGQKIRRVVGRPALDAIRAALTASGGICSPVNVDWSIPVFAVADTPLINDLASFQADRGGLTYVTPPDIAALAGATEVWTEAMDAGSPGNADTKPVLAIVCGSPVTVFVDAVPTRLGFGNMQGRFSPEWTEANTELSVAAAARIRELNILSHIDAASTLCNSFNLLGTARDLLATVDQVVAYYKDVHRLADGVNLRAVFPRWARDAMRADLARELAHDEDDSSPLGVSNAMLDGYFAARGVTVTWMMDGRAAKTTGGSTLQYPVQTYTKVTSGAIAPWITKTVWNLFVEGTFQHLDGGRLDIGVVRDSTLDATNDYELFNEVFEGVAFRGVEALTIISPVLPNGASAGTIATASYTGA